MKGTIVRFYRNRGFGFIKPSDGGKQVLVHWSNLVTDDKWPYIKRGTEVEFELIEKDNNVKRSATEVTLLGGEKIPIFTPNNSDRVSNNEDIYCGSIKFFDYRKGFGVIKPDDEITWNNVTSENGVFFSRDAIVSTGGAKGKVLNLRHGTNVTFKVHTGKRGLGAHELKKEDGNPIEYEARRMRKGGIKRRRSLKKGEKKKTSKKTKKKKKKETLAKKTKEELMEEREIDEEENIYTGTVKAYRAEKGFGFISINEDITFKGATAKGKIYLMKEDIMSHSDVIGVNVETKVMFKVYKDSLGLGAYEVLKEDGSSFKSQPAEEITEPATEGAKKNKMKSPKKVPVQAKKKTTKKKAIKNKTKKKIIKKTKKRTTKK